MAKNKGSRIIITLECSHKSSQQKHDRKNGVSRYTTTKNRKNTPNRIELKKFCSNCNTHQIFKEIK